jgi:hypothetical protein
MLILFRAEHQFSRAYGIWISFSRAYGILDQLDPPR